MVYRKICTDHDYASCTNNKYNIWECDQLEKEVSEIIDVDDMFDRTKKVRAGEGAERAELKCRTLQTFGMFH